MRVLRGNRASGSGTRVRSTSVYHLCSVQHQHALIEQNTAKTLVRQLLRPDRAIHTLRRGRSRNGERQRSKELPGEPKERSNRRGYSDSFDRRDDSRRDRHDCGDSRGGPKVKEDRLL